MKVYYIAKVEDDVCYLNTGNGEHNTTVDILNLKEFSKENLVIGYDSLTGSVKVKEREDILKYVISKMRLSTSNLEMFKMTKDEEEFQEDYLNIYSCSEVNMSGDDIEITISDIDAILGYNLQGIFKGLRIMWGEIIEDMINKLPQYADSIKKRLTINLDIQGSYRTIKGDNKRFLGVWNSKWLDIVKYNILNKDMFKDTLYIYALFSLGGAKIPQIRMINCEFNFEDCEFNPDLRTRFLLPSNINGNIKYNDTFYKCVHENLYSFEPECKFADEVLIQPPVDYLINIPKELDNQEELCYLIYFEEIKYSELEKIKDRAYIKNRTFITGGTICVNRLIFDKPLNESTDKSVLNMKVEAKRVEYTEDFDVDLDYKYIEAMANVVTALWESESENFRVMVTHSDKYWHYQCIFWDMTLFRDDPTEVQNRVTKKHRKTVSKSLKVISNLFKQNSNFDTLVEKFSFIQRNSDCYEDYLTLLNPNDIRTKFLAFMLWGSGRIEFIEEEEGEIDYDDILYS